MMDKCKIASFPTISAFSYEDDRLELSKDPEEGVFYVTQYYGRKGDGIQGIFGARGSFVHGCAADLKFATILFEALIEDIKRKYEKEAE